MDLDLNMELRSIVIEESLKIEKLSKELLQLVFRLFEPNSKTMGNSSSSLSLKNKIDFLYDLGDLTKEEYNWFIKVMEVRNQFAHNADATSFKALSEFNPEISLYLKRKFTDIIQSDEEQEYKTAFLQLSNNCYIKLKTLITEYNVGFDSEVKGRFTLKSISNVIDLIKLSYYGFKNKNIDKTEFDKIGEEFVSNLKIALMKDSLVDSAKKDPIIRNTIKNRIPNKAINKE